MVSPEHKFALGDPKQLSHPFFPLTFPLRNQSSEPQEPRGHDRGCYVPMAGPGTYSSSILHVYKYLA